MIDLALGAIVAQLNQSLRRSFGVAEEVAVLGTLLEQDGELSPQVDNRVVVTLVNVERETMTASPGPRVALGGRGGVTPPPVFLVLTVLFAAHFGRGNYAEALKFLSGTIGFFQSRPVLDRANTPELDGRIERLVLDMANLGLQELNNLWSIQSGRYLPSVVYRVRLLAVDMDQVSGSATPVVTPRTGLGR